MINFQRIARLSVFENKNSRYDINNLRLKFTCIKTDNADANSLNITVYNLSDSTRALLESTKNSVELSCGYQSSGLIRLFQGNISHGYTIFQQPNVLTIVQAGEGFKIVRDTRVQISYEKSVTAKQIVDDISKAMGLELRQTSAKLTGTYERGWTFSGPARNALSEVCNKFGLVWSIQNNTIQISEKLKPASNVSVLVSQSTGMLGTPTRQEQIEDLLTGAKNPPQILVETLLNPKIEVGGIVTLVARGFKESQYLVKNINHTGDTRGEEWITKLRLGEFDA